MSKYCLSVGWYLTSFINSLSCCSLTNLHFILCFCFCFLCCCCCCFIGSQFSAKQRFYLCHVICRISQTTSNVMAFSFTHTHTHARSSLPSHIFPYINEQITGISLILSYTLSLIASLFFCLFLSKLLFYLFCQALSIFIYSYNVSYALFYSVCCCFLFLSSYFSFSH